MLCVLSLFLALIFHRWAVDNLQYYAIILHGELCLSLCIHKPLHASTLQNPCSQHLTLKGEVHSKMITSYLVFGALSQMVKIRGACDKPFWIYKRLDICAALEPNCDAISVVASLACPAHKSASSTTKTLSLSGVGRYEVIVLG